jgi:hypothetical protein
MAVATQKRPWYLVLVLLGAFALGMLGTADGLSAVNLYRNPFDASAQGLGIADSAERDAVVARAVTWMQALDHARARGWPLGVAVLVLGGAVSLFALRTLGGSGGARTALVQLVIAQAGVNVADYWLMRDVAEPHARFWAAQQTALTHEPMNAEVLRQAWVVGLSLETIGAALVVLGLTRRRSREFLDALTEAVEER